MTAASPLPTLSALLSQTTLDDDTQILQAANTALKKSSTDTQAHHVKAVALLKLDRYDDAVKAIEGGGTKVQTAARLEYAYALYKAGRPREAAEVASAGGNGRGLKHVEAQARYRLEEFARVQEMYAALSAQLAGDAEADLRVNVGAVEALLQFAGQGEMVGKKKPAREDLEAFETAYNAACGGIARGELGQAEVLLKRAREMVGGLEDVGEEERRAEEAPIALQMVYVLVKLGRLEEAEEVARGLEMGGVGDKSTRFIAQVNGAAAERSPKNPFLTQRLLGRDLEELKPDTPFAFQAAVMKQNRHALDLQAMKFGGTADSTAAVLAEQHVPNLDPFYNSLSVVNAAAHAKNQTSKEALKHILPVLESRPSDVGLVLTTVQLYVLTGNSGAAIDLLEKFLARLEQSTNKADLDARFAPGLVGATVSLYHSQGRKGHLQREFAKAAAHWREKSTDTPPGVLHLLKAAGGALLESSAPEHRTLSADIFTTLSSRDPGDRYAAAGLLAASPEAATEEHKAILTPIDRLTSTLDAAALEDAGLAQPPLPTLATGANIRKRPGPDAQAPAKRHKIRESRMPKDFDPNRKPDPERWLPLRDRSSYKPKGKKGKAKAGMMSQGAAPALESESSRPATPGPGGEVAKGKQQQQGKGGKKKGKGGKW